MNFYDELKILLFFLFKALTNLLEFCMRPEKLVKILSYTHYSMIKNAHAKKLFKAMCFKMKDEHKN